MRMKFSALNVNYDGPSIDFLGFKEGIKEWYPRKSRYFTVKLLASLS